MSQHVVLPSTLASPSRIFLSPFPPPNDQHSQDHSHESQQIRSSAAPTKQKKHSICPYKISTDLARTCDIYNKQSPPYKIPPAPLAVSLPPPKRSTSLIKPSDDSVLLDKYTLSPISNFSSSGDDEEEEIEDDDDYDVVSLYYYNNDVHRDVDLFSHSDPPSLSSYFSSTSTSSSLSISPPSRVRMRASMSTPLLKTRQSTPVTSSTPTAARLPKWIKHVSQTPGMLEKKISRGFPFRSTVPVPLCMATFQNNSNSSTANATVTISTTTKALYWGSPWVRQYLDSATKADRFDDMLRFGFPCPNALHQQHKQEHTTTVMDENDPPAGSFKGKKSRCPITCHQCGGHQRLMTLRVTLTPLHARANENDIYKSNKKQSRKIRHTTHPTITSTTTTPSPL